MSSVGVIYHSLAANPQTEHRDNVLIILCPFVVTGIKTSYGSDTTYPDNVQTSGQHDCRVGQLQVYYYVVMFVKRSICSCFISYTY